MKRTINLDRFSKAEAALASGIVCSLISAVATVFLTKCVDSVLPPSFLIRAETPDMSNNRVYALEFASCTNGKQLLGIVVEYPIWYYRVSVGNTTRENTGTIHISADFPQQMKMVWALIGDKTIKEKNAQTLHFQMSQLTARRGMTFSIAVASLELPDINKIRIQVTSAAGDFEKVPMARYNGTFTKPVDK